MCHYIQIWSLINVGKLKPAFTRQKVFYAAKRKKALKKPQMTNFTYALIHFLYYVIDQINATAKATEAKKLIRTQ